MLTAHAGAVTVGVAALAYFRGLVHSIDFDHISMIDNSTRKFVAEGRRPASVGLAFSTGHATVVILTDFLAVSGASVVQVALDENSRAAQVLGVVGLSVSGLCLNPQPEVSPTNLTPRGPAARIMTAPLRRVRHPRHVYLIGILFSLGFDTSSQIGLLVTAGIAAMAGAPVFSLLSLPFLSAAAMTLGDNANGLMMLKMYETANDDPARKINYNLLITGVSIVSASTVGLLAAATLLTTSRTSGRNPTITRLPGHRVRGLPARCPLRRDRHGRLLTLATFQAACLKAAHDQPAPVDYRWLAWFSNSSRAIHSVEEQAGVDDQRHTDGHRNEGRGPKVYRRYAEDALPLLNGPGICGNRP